LSVTFRALQNFFEIKVKYILDMDAFKLFEVCFKKKNIVTVNFKKIFKFDSIFILFIVIDGNVCR